MSNKEVEKQEEKGAFDTANEKLKQCIININASEEGKIKIDGNNYVKVSQRIKTMREFFGFEICINTEILTMDEKRVIVKATLSTYKNEMWHQIATGHAEEIRDQSEINKFAAIENAETSAIGRALASLGLVGDEFASAEELNKMTRMGVKNINEKQVKESSNKNMASVEQIDYIEKLIVKTNTDKKAFCDHYEINNINELTKEKASSAIGKLRKKEANSKKSTGEKGYQSINVNKTTLAEKLNSQKPEDTKIEETKVEETKVEETKVEETKVEETKVEETKVEETKVEETKVEETKVEETKVEETKVDETKVDETKVDETKVVDTKEKDKKSADNKKEKKSTSKKNQVKKSAEERKLEEKQKEQEESHKKKDDDLDEDDLIIV